MTTSCLFPQDLIPLLDELDELTGQKVSDLFLSSSTQVWLRLTDQTEQRMKTIVASLEKEQWVLPSSSLPNS